MGALAPGERQRIYEEEKARLEAQARLKSEAAAHAAQDKSKGWLLLLGIAVVLIIGMKVWSAIFPDTPSASSQPTPAVTASPDPAVILAKVATANEELRKLDLPGTVSFRIVLVNGDEPIAVLRGTSDFAMQWLGAPNDQRNYLIRKFGAAAAAAYGAQSMSVFVQDPDGQEIGHGLYLP